MSEKGRSLDSCQLSNSLGEWKWKIGGADHEGLNAGLRQAFRPDGLGRVS